MIAAPKYAINKYSGKSIQWIFEYTWQLKRFRRLMYKRWQRFTSDEAFYRYLFLVMEIATIGVHYSFIRVNWQKFGGKKSIGIAKLANNSSSQTKWVLLIVMWFILWTARK